MLQLRHGASRQGHSYVIQVQIEIEKTFIGCKIVYTF